MWIMLITLQEKPGIMNLAEKHIQANLNAIFQNLFLKMIEDFNERKRHQSEEEESHRQKFEYICQYVKEHIIEKAHVVRILYLRELYCTYMQNHYPNHYNKNYKTDKFKSKLN